MYWSLQYLSASSSPRTPPWIPDQMDHPQVPPLQQPGQQSVSVHPDGLHQAQAGVLTLSSLLTILCYKSRASLAIPPLPLPLLPPVQLADSFCLTAKQPGECLLHLVTLYKLTKVCTHVINFCLLLRPVLKLTVIILREQWLVVIGSRGQEREQLS